MATQYCLIYYDKHIVYVSKFACVKASEEQQYTGKQTQAAHHLGTYVTDRHACWDRQMQSMQPPLYSCRTEITTKVIGVV